MYETPKSIRVNTGDQGPVYEQISQFFIEVKEK